MEKFKVGDKIVLTKADKDDIEYGFKNGDIFTIHDIDREWLWIGNNCAFHENQIILLNSYQNSKRKELHDKIIKSKFKFSDLSLAIGKSEFYLSNELKESRFNARGDLNNKQYLNLVTSINRGIAILSEDYPPVYESKVANHNLAEIDYKVSQLTEKPKIKECKIHITTVYGIIFILFFAVISLALALFKLLY